MKKTTSKVALSQRDVGTNLKCIKKKTPHFSVLSVFLTYTWKDFPQRCLSETGTREVGDVHSQFVPQTAVQ